MTEIQSSAADFQAPTNGYQASLSSRAPNDDWPAVDDDYRAVIVHCGPVMHDRHSVNDAWQSVIHGWQSVIASWQDSPACWGAYVAAWRTVSRAMSPVAAVPSQDRRDGARC